MSEAAEATATGEPARYPREADLDLIPFKFGATQDSGRFELTPGLARHDGALYGRALARQIGRFELADHSTIFLDEIGDLPADVQVKLLRVLEERQIERLGSPKAIHVDVRIIAATHRNLEQQIAKEAFREDLFYRLNVFPIHVPPLRERVEDIPLLVWRFVDEFSKTFDRRIDCIPREAEVPKDKWKVLKEFPEEGRPIAVWRPEPLKIWEYVGPKPQTFPGPPPQPGAPAAPGAAAAP